MGSEINLALGRGGGGGCPSGVCLSVSCPGGGVYESSHPYYTTNYLQPVPTLIYQGCFDQGRQ